MLTSATAGSERGFIFHLVDQVHESAALWAAVTSFDALLVAAAETADTAATAATHPVVLRAVEELQSPGGADNDDDDGGALPRRPAAERAHLHLRVMSLVEEDEADTGVGSVHTLGTGDDPERARRQTICWRLQSEPSLRSPEPVDAAAALGTWPAHPAAGLTGVVPVSALAIAAREACLRAYAQGAKAGDGVGGADGAGDPPGGSAQARPKSAGRTAPPPRREPALSRRHRRSWSSAPSRSGRRPSAGAAGGAGGRATAAGGLLPRASASRRPSQLCTIPEELDPDDKAAGDEHCERGGAARRPSSPAAGQSGEARSVGHGGQLGSGDGGGGGATAAKASLLLLLRQVLQMSQPQPGSRRPIEQLLRSAVTAPASFITGGAASGGSALLPKEQVGPEHGDRLASGRSSEFATSGAGSGGSCANASRSSTDTDTDTDTGTGTGSSCGNNSFSSRGGGAGAGSSGGGVDDSSSSSGGGSGPSSGGSSGSDCEQALHDRFTSERDQDPCPGLKTDRRPPPTGAEPMVELRQLHLAQASDGWRLPPSGAASASVAAARSSSPRLPATAARTCGPCSACGGAVAVDACRPGRPSRHQHNHSLSHGYGHGRSALSCVLAAAAASVFRRVLRYGPGTSRRYSGAEGPCSVLRAGDTPSEARGALGDACGGVPGGTAGGTAGEGPAAVAGCAPAGRLAGVAAAAHCGRAASPPGGLLVQLGMGACFGRNSGVGTHFNICADARAHAHAHVPLRLSSRSEADGAGGHAARRPAGGATVRPSLEGSRPQERGAGRQGPWAPPAAQPQGPGDQRGGEALPVTQPRPPSPASEPEAPLHAPHPAQCQDQDLVRMLRRGRLSHSDLLLASEALSVGAQLGALLRREAGGRGGVAPGGLEACRDLPLFQRASGVVDAISDGRVRAAAAEVLRRYVESRRGPVEEAIRWLLREACLSAEAVGPVAGAAGVHALDDADAKTAVGDAHSRARADADSNAAGRCQHP